MTEPPRRQLVIVTGLSGAGKASILRVLEDLGFETVDNPPLPILEELVGDDPGPIAVGVDTRSRGFCAAEVADVLRRLRARADTAVSLVFATAEDAVLLRRFSETRRRHPLTPGGAMGNRVADGIAREAELLAPLRAEADLVVDTSDLPLPELRRMIEARFGRGASASMAVAVMSFSYAKGLPRDADLVFDMRFLRNPHYDPALRPLTGRDAGVAAFVEGDPDFAPFLARMTGLLDPLLPRYAREGKKYLTVAIGCTGGRHRSVLVAERLASHLLTLGWRVDVIHRELALAASGAGTHPAGREAQSHPS
jgi:UPF0042 nucleotide-binding protein